jgi:hypothetical protein
MIQSFEQGKDQNQRIGKTMELDKMQQDHI